jgi:hypothetical protein
VIDDVLALISDPPQRADLSAMLAELNSLISHRERRRSQWWLSWIQLVRQVRRYLAGDRAVELTVDQQAELIEKMVEYAPAWPAMLDLLEAASDQDLTAWFPRHGRLGLALDQAIPDSGPLRERLDRFVIRRFGGWAGLKASCAAGPGPGRRRAGCGPYGWGPRGCVDAG